MGRLTKRCLPGVLGAVLALSLLLTPKVGAITPLPIPDPKPGGFGIEATKSQPPPTLSATITTPGNGASFSSSPITVSGICPDELLVQLYNNDVMVGAVMCENGSFQVEVSLFAGINELKAIVYDNLEQAGPASNVVSVNYTDTNFARFGELITLTSSYGRRSAPSGSGLTWPLQLSGGTGPYAFSIDWGDGSDLQLMSQSLSGLVGIEHVYKRAGIYQVNVKVTDSNGVSAFLQVIAVSSGQVDAAAAAADDKSGEASSKPVFLWVPTVVLLLLLLPTYWLGKRSQLVQLRQKMLKERDAYHKKNK